ncbi:protein of unknown function [Xenorhabdus doucetiae]|uniref:Uncharacterized protein n=1 Tax=Xenorhabdus doucetiae TaxID=351671 RepID=A0A068QSG6_9GAMM|nr:protein of unknown function [Xenorhabdus doucetiae]
MKKRLDGNVNKIGYSDSAIELDIYAQVNYKEIGSLTDAIDDYFGAIGKATLKLAVRGYVDKWVFIKIICGESCRQENIQDTFLYIMKILENGKINIIKEGILLCFQMFYGFLLCQKIE